MPVCARKQTNGPPSIDQGFSTGSCNSCHALSARVVHPPTHHPPNPPVPPFPLVQNLSSKQIVPTDNLQPKTDNAKRHHQLLRVKDTEQYKMISAGVDKYLSYQMCEISYQIDDN